MDAPQARGSVYEVGGPEVLSYVDMLRRASRIQNKRHLPVVTVPLLTPRLSTYWLAFVTDVDRQTARNLIDSMTNEVVVRDDSIQTLVPFKPTTYDDAVLTALAERARETRM